MNPIVYFNGTYLRKDEVRISPDDRGFLFADGVYDVLSSYGGRFFRKDAHLDRLANGLRALDIQGVEIDALSEAADELLRRNPSSGDQIIYIQVTRGTAPRKHAFPPLSVPPTVYMTVSPFVRKGDPERGAPVITVPDTRWARCDIKSVALLPNCIANQRAQEAGAHEALFVRDGVVLEATASSFFGVFGGEVRTAPKTNYILPGITRDVVLEICEGAGIPAKEAPIFLHELQQAEECFLTGTTTEVLPVIQIDGHPVAGGTPGPVARDLVRRFRELTHSEAVGTAAISSAQ